ncbi:MAG: CBS domain-containing protein [Planctomycetota bacterium]|nr:MAG: CBS domain-containing protein [Planctomycetota bacterium]
MSAASLGASRTLDGRARAKRRWALPQDWKLIALGAFIGSLTALGAIGFMWLLHVAERGADDLLRRWPVWTLPLVPVTGGLLTGLLVHFFAREAKGHGVPEVMDALYRQGGRIRKRVAIVKSIASACTIGSGGSAGAEGPIVQIGSAIGSACAQWLRLSREHSATLLGCGAAAGIASVFNAPIAGVFFVLEIILRDFSLRTFAPIVVASVFSTAVTQAALGRNEALFATQGLASYVFTLPELPSYAVLGMVCGLAAVLFIKALYFAEDVAERAPGHPVLKPVVGALLLSLMGLAYLALEGRLSPELRELPPFFGNGYESVRSMLEPDAYAGALGLGTLASLFVFKLLGTCFTLGSGGSGGIFAPSLFMGASVGGLFGAALGALGLLPQGGSPAAYALVGMAAVVAGATHAPLTAILIIFEITRDVYVLLPIMLAAVLATATAQLLLRDSIYTLKLRRRGVLVGDAADLTILRKLRVSDTPLVKHEPVHPEDPLAKLLELNRRLHLADFLVTDHSGAYEGLVTGSDLRTALLEQEAIPLLTTGEVMRTDLPVVTPDETLDSVLDKFSRFDVASLPVVDGQVDGEAESEGTVKGAAPLGLITRGRLMQRYQTALRQR